ncbi:hypothetical protein FBU31_000300 [Coemansia sp. 'formosensis']|nr:hypothetical protein FBU31_000300 [Coemansia sp. 'formosensis']
MLARRAIWLFVNSKAFVPTSRNQRLSPIFTTRGHSTHSPTGPIADLQKTIFEEVRLFQQHGKSIPWFQLAAKYCLSIDTLHTIFNQAEVDAQRRKNQSVLVTRTAERHFGRVLGMCNWETVASELDLPPIECLDLFDASNSTIQPRSLIETYGGWAKADMERLKQFTEANYADSSTVDWGLVGVYMNVDSLECQRIGLGTYSETLNEAGYRRICELRDSGLRWKDIHQYLLQYPNVSSLMSSYYRFKAKLKGRTSDKFTTEWTDTERKRVSDLIGQHVESTTRSELVHIIERELPAKPLCDIRLFSRLHIRRLKTGRMKQDQVTRVRELVHKHGEDWDHIGEELGVLPSRARHNWTMYGGVAGHDPTWTFDETHQMQHLIDSGIKPYEAAQLLGRRSIRSCQARVRTAKSSGKYVLDVEMPKA